MWSLDWIIKQMEELLPVVPSKATLASAQPPHMNTRKPTQVFPITLKAHGSCSSRCQTPALVYQIAVLTNGSLWPWESQSTSESPQSLDTSRLDRLPTLFGLWFLASTFKHLCSNFHFYCDYINLFLCDTDTILFHEDFMVTLAPPKLSRTPFQSQDP